MTIVFLSGSRHISRLNRDVRSRLDNMMHNGLNVITGDANGADKAMQTYLHSASYRDITIYFVGEKPRNNVGDWAVEKVPAERNLKGRDFFAQKDKAMSQIADFGFVLWDGKSPGSVQNMLWLTSQKKKVIVFLNPLGKFVKLYSRDDLRALLLFIDKNDLNDIERKIDVRSLISEYENEQWMMDV